MKWSPENDSKEAKPGPKNDFKTTQDLANKLDFVLNLI